MSVTAWKRLILAANLLLGAALAAAGAVAYLEVIRQEVPRREARGVARAPKGALPERIAPLQDFEDIWRMRATPDDNVVRIEKAPEPPPPDEERVRQILHQLFKLVGVLFNLTDPGASYAVLQIQSGARGSRTVSKGESISGAQVDSIERDRVWFVYQGIKADLEMAAGDVVMGRPGPSVAPRPGGLPGRADALQPVSAAPPSEIQADQTFRGSRKVADNHWQIERAEVQYVQSNQTQILNDTVPKPSLDREGKQIGVELSQVPQGSYAAQRGFEQGDVVQSVNGIPVNSMDFQSIAARLKGARTLTLVVLRRGQPRTVTYNLR